MINLLPPDYRSRLRFSRLNIRLGQWLVIGFFLIGLQLVILAAAWLYMDREVKNLNREVANTEAQLKNQNLDEVKQQADEISQNVRVINQVLGRQINFSKLIPEIGKVLPSDTVLNSLTLTKVDGALDLATSAKDYTSAAQIAVNLSDPKNDIFAKVDIVSINCSSAATGNYPCNANFKALFDKDARSRFLNPATGGNQ